MLDKIKQISAQTKTIVLLFSQSKDLLSLGFSKQECAFAEEQRKQSQDILIVFPRMDEKFMRVWLLQPIPEAKKEDSYSEYLEKIRLLSLASLSYLEKNKIEKCVIWDKHCDKDVIFAYTEAFLSAAYHFEGYKKKPEKKGLKKISILSSEIGEKDVRQLEIIRQMLWNTRDWVNMPACRLNACKLAEQAQKIGKESGVQVHVWTKSEIQKQKMGGILGVNLGSIDEPTFTLMEYKPKKGRNKKPIVLIGKGVTFDSGGMNIKTDDYMTDMKSDMAGSAVVANVICAAAKSELPLHIIALLPATDNRLNGNALVPGDVIRMYDGTMVEIVNTDAEGRLLLADALAYAQLYQPELAITIATLTGAASRALGKQAIAAMQEDAQDAQEKMTEVGLKSYERVWFFPMWKEYENGLKSNVADIKNCGPAEAGMITAAKFLSHFNKYPFIHLDIAGTAFLSAADGYRPQGATASGARLLYQFLCDRAKN